MYENGNKIVEPMISTPKDLIFSSLLIDLLADKLSTRVWWARKHIQKPWISYYSWVPWTPCKKTYACLQDKDESFPNLTHALWDKFSKCVEYETKLTHFENFLQSVLN